MVSGEHWGRERTPKRLKSNSISKEQLLDTKHRDLVRLCGRVFFHPKCLTSTFSPRELAMKKNTLCLFVLALGTFSVGCGSSEPSVNEVTATQAEIDAESEAYEAEMEAAENDTDGEG